MDKSYILKLLRKYQEGHLTDEEHHFLLSYYNLFSIEPDVMETLDQEQRDHLKKDIQSVVWDRVCDAGAGDSKVRFMRNRWAKISVAAAVIIIAFATGTFYLSRNPQQEEQVVAQVADTKENSLIFLPDGSKVIINGDGKLNYPSTFDGQTSREVTLEGEAYFDIQHDTSKPFIVHSGKLKTIVLGTAFNIRAVEAEDKITITVTRGKVKVVDQNRDKMIAILTPNQQIIYSREGITAEKREIENSDKIISWKKERGIRCDNLTLTEAAGLLEDQYHVKILIDEAIIQSQRFTATFPKNESIEQVLNSICEFNGLVYRYDKTTNTIKINDK